jgi:hypothetical protein
VSRHDRGLYETLITEALEEQLGSLGERLEARRSELHEAEAADRLALHLSRVVERAIASLDKNHRVEKGTALARQLVDVIVQTVEATAANAVGPERPVSPAHMLRSVLGRLPDGMPETIAAPLIPLLERRCSRTRRASRASAIRCERRSTDKSPRLASNVHIVRGTVSRSLRIGVDGDACHWRRWCGVQ